MSYINQALDPRRRIAAIASVAAIHAAIGVGLIVGLTVSGIAPPVDTWDPFNITPERKPPPPPPTPPHPPQRPVVIIPPTPPQPPERSVVIIPPTPLPALKPQENVAVERTELTDSTVVTVVDRPLVGPRPEPLPASLFAPRGARPVNSPLGWLSNDDYPSGALRNEIEGSAAYRLIVGTNGRVSACDVTRSTGNGQLDDATCRLIVRRARFEAASDESGAKVVGTYTGTVRWEIPE